MKNTIKTDRLIVRPMTNDEWNQIIDRIFDANEAYIQFGYEQDDDLRDALAEPFVDAVVYYTFYLPFTREVIGYVEFTPDNKNLGFYMFEEYRHQGFAYEGIKAFMEACKKGEVTGVHETTFTADTMDTNIPCINLLKKLGFRGCGRGFSITGGYGFNEFECVA